MMFLVGCNGSRVVNNMYGAAGASYAVDNSMVYLGEVPLSFYSGCDGPGCTSIDRVHSKVVEDLFVKVEDGKVVEFAVLAYERLTGPYHFLPSKSEKVVFGGREFGEAFGSFQASSVTDPYLRMIADAGYAADGDEYFFRDLWRNATKKSRQFLRYGCSTKSVPEPVGNDKESIKDFVRERMASRIVAPGS